MEGHLTEENFFLDLKNYQRQRYFFFLQCFANEELIRENTYQIKLFLENGQGTDCAHTL